MRAIKLHVNWTDLYKWPECYTCSKSLEKERHSSRTLSDMDLPVRDTFLPMRLLSPCHVCLSRTLSDTSPAPSRHHIQQKQFKSADPRQGEFRPDPESLYRVRGRNLDKFQNLTRTYLSKHTSVIKISWRSDHLFRDMSQIGENTLSRNVEKFFLKILDPYCCGLSLNSVNTALQRSLWTSSVFCCLRSVWRMYQMAYVLTIDAHYREIQRLGGIVPTQFQFW